MEGDFIREGDALIRNAFGKDPDGLEETEWCRLYAESIHLMKLERRVMEAAMETAVGRVMVQMFSKEGNGDDYDAMDT